MHPCPSLRPLPWSVSPVQGSFPRSALCPHPVAQGQRLAGPLSPSLVAGPSLRRCPALCPTPGEAGNLHPLPAPPSHALGVECRLDADSPNAASARPLPQAPVSSGVGHVSALGGESSSQKAPSIPSPAPCPPAPFPTTRSHHGQLVKGTLAVLGHCCHRLDQDLIRKREAGPQLPVPHLPAGLGASDSTPPRRLRAAPSHRVPLSGAPPSFGLRPQTSEVAWAPLSLMPHTP